VKLRQHEKIYDKCDFVWTKLYFFSEKTKMFSFFYFEPNLSTTLHIPLFNEGEINVNKAK